MTNKHIKFALALAMLAVGNEDMHKRRTLTPEYSEEDKRLKLESDKVKSQQIKLKNGLKKFCIEGVEIYALNEKSAIKNLIN